MNVMHSLAEDFKEIFGTEENLNHYQEQLRGDLYWLIDGYNKSMKRPSEYTAEDAEVEIQELESRMGKPIDEATKAQFYEFLERERLFDNGD